MWPGRPASVGTCWPSCTTTGPAGSTSTTWPRCASISAAESATCLRWLWPRRGLPTGGAGTRRRKAAWLRPVGAALSGSSLHRESRVRLLEGTTDVAEYRRSYNRFLRLKEWGTRPPSPANLIPARIRLAKSGLVISSTRTLQALAPAGDRSDADENCGATGRKDRCATIKVLVCCGSWASRRSSWPG